MTAIFKENSFTKTESHLLWNVLLRQKDLPILSSWLSVYYITPHSLVSQFWSATYLQIKKRNTLMKITLLSSYFCPQK
jgi:hypothetical protein